MDESTRRMLIERYREGYSVVEAALQGISEEQLDRPDPDGGWTARQVVHHLADSEMTSAIRMRRVLCEDHAEIQGYDEEEFARRLFYDKRPIPPALAALKAARDTSSQIIERLSDADWQRSGYQSESGAYSVETWLEIYAAHCHDHADQIRRAAGV